MHIGPLKRIRPAAAAGALLALALLSACSDGGPSGPAPIEAPAVARVEVTPDTVHLVVGGTRGLHAVPYGSDGRPLPGRVVTWTSGDETVARVDVSGNVTALGSGTVAIVATSEGRRGEARIMVAPPPPPAVASVQVTGGDIEIEPRQSRRLGVALRSADGAVLADRKVTWSSSDSAGLRVLADGTVVGVRRGSYTVTAASEGRSGTTRVKVVEWSERPLVGIGDASLPTPLYWSTRMGGTTREVRFRLTEGVLRTDGERYRLRLLGWMQMGDGLAVQAEIGSEGIYRYNLFDGTMTFYVGDETSGTMGFRGEWRDDGSLSIAWNPEPGVPHFPLVFSAR